MKWYWLSFCDAKRPKGTQFLGAAIVAASGKIEAVRASHILGCNPGGEIALTEATSTGPEMAGVIERWAERLLTRDDAAVFDAEMLAAKERDGNG